MATYLITGASRGLGLALVAELAALPKSEVDTIFATTRQANAPRLTELAESMPGRVVPVQLDPNDAESLRAAVSKVEHQLQGKGLDVLVNNSGVVQVTQGKAEKLERLTETFHTNVTLTHLVTSAFMPLLRQGRRKAVANISTEMGSIGRAAKYTWARTHSYKISKAGMNMLTAQYAQDYADEGFSFLAISPGWLRTDMGGENAHLPVETGAQAVLKIVRQAGPEHNGRFFNIHAPGWENAPGPTQYDGKELPW